MLSPVSMFYLPCPRRQIKWPLLQLTVPNALLYPGLGAAACGYIQASSHTRTTFFRAWIGHSTDCFPIEESPVLYKTGLWAGPLNSLVCKILSEWIYMFFWIAVNGLEQRLLKGKIEMIPISLLLRWQGRYTEMEVARYLLQEERSVEHMSGNVFIIKALGDLSHAPVSLALVVLPAIRITFEGFLFSLVSFLCRVFNSSCLDWKERSPTPLLCEISGSPPWVHTTLLSCLANWLHSLGHFSWAFHVHCRAKLEMSF